jgi:hypothetical protein
MEPVRILWIFIFLFFALILIFTWSKMVIISGKIRSISSLLDNIMNTTKSNGNTEEQPQAQLPKNKNAGEKT